MRVFLLIIIIAIFTGCNSSGADEDDKDRQIGVDNAHPDYRPSDNFIASRGFDYDKANDVGAEDIKRGERELHNHRPKIEVIDKGHKIILKFDSHPHSKKHFWAWVEIVDYDGNLIYENIPAPLEDSPTFEYTVFSEIPFRKRVRIRCYCQIHGEFIDYINLPVFEKKTILDRQGPQE